MLQALSKLVRTKTNSIFMTLGTAAALLQVFTGLIGDLVLASFLLGLLYLRSKI